MRGVSQTSMLSMCLFMCVAIDLCVSPFCFLSRLDMDSLSDYRLVMRKITTLSEAQKKSAHCACMCSYSTRQRVFLFGHMSPCTCTFVCVHLVCVFLSLLREGPTHRLSLTDSLFIATERKKKEREREVNMRRRRKEERESRKSQKDSERMERRGGNIFM